MSADIEPCPHCGVELSPFGDRYTHPENGCWLEHVALEPEEFHLWNRRAAIPQPSAEHQQRAPDQNAQDIGFAHIICDQAGIPQGEIIGRLVALSGKGDADDLDASRYRWLRMVYGNRFRLIPGPVFLAETADDLDAGIDKQIAYDAASRCRAQGGDTKEWINMIGNGDYALTAPQTAPSQAKSEGDAK